MEIWKPIKDYESLYEISNYGRVRSLRNNIILKPSPTNKGYLNVSLCKDGNQRNHNIHRLVALTFLPNPDGLPCVNHKDENKTNNHVENLEWCSYYYNNVYGNRLTKSALKLSIPVICVETGKIYSGAYSAERETGIRQSGICQCCHHKRKSAGGYHWEFIS